FRPSSTRRPRSPTARRSCTRSSGRTGATRGRSRRAGSSGCSRGGAGEGEGLFAEADVTVSERYRQNRLIPNAIEPRAVFVTPIPATGEFTMWSTTQVPHIARITLSGVTGIPEAKLRVIAPDVGGG